jgi:hypothetical protein
LIGPSEKKVETMKMPHRRRFYGKMECPPFPPPFGQPIEVRRGGLWAKHMGLKQGAIGNTHGEQIGNLLGTEEK